MSVDTERSLAALQTLFADNTLRAISEQDLRDFLLSAFGGYGSLLVPFPAAQQSNLGVTGVTPSDLANWFAAGPVQGIVATPSIGTLQVGVDGVYWVSFHATFVAPANRTLTFNVDVGGTPLLGLVAQRKLDASGSVTSMSFAGPASFVAGSSAKIQVSADQSGASITLQFAAFSMKRIG